MGIEEKLPAGVLLPSVEKLVNWSRKSLMRFTLKLMANLTDARDGDAMDKVINSLSKIAPAA